MCVLWDRIKVSQTELEMRVGNEKQEARNDDGSTSSSSRSSSGS